MLSKITDFLISNGLPYEREFIELCVSKHLEYDTYSIVKDNSGEIVGFCGFNVNEDTGEVLDVIIRPDFRNKRILKLLCYLGWVKFPHLKYFSFERRKYPEGKRKTYSISTFLRR